MELEVTGLSLVAERKVFKVAAWARILRTETPGVGIQEQEEVEKCSVAEASKSSKWYVDIREEMEARQGTLLVTWVLHLDSEEAKGKTT